MPLPKIVSLPRGGETRIVLGFETSGGVEGLSASSFIP